MGTPGWHLPVSVCYSPPPTPPPTGVRTHRRRLPGQHGAGTVSGPGPALCIHSDPWGWRPLSHGHGNRLNEDRASLGGSFTPDRGFQGENRGSLCWPSHQWCGRSLCVLPSFWSALEESQSVEGGGKASRGQEAGALQRHFG